MEAEWGKLLGERSRLEKICCLSVWSNYPLLNWARSSNGSSRPSVELKLSFCPDRISQNLLFPAVWVKCVLAESFCLRMHKQNSANLMRKYNTMSTRTRTHSPGASGMRTRTGEGGNSCCAQFSLSPSSMCYSYCSKVCIIFGGICREIHAIFYTTVRKGIHQEALALFSIKLI